MIHAVVHGRLGRDPEIKEVGGKVVCKLSVASDYGYGEKKITTWVNVDVWGARADHLAKHLSKGSEVVCRGAMTTREWEKDGIKRQSIEVRADDVSFCGGGGSRPKLAIDESVPF